MSAPAKTSVLKEVSTRYLASADLEPYRERPRANTGGDHEKAWSELAPTRLTDWGSGRCREDLNAQHLHRIAGLLGDVERSSMVETPKRILSPRSAKCEAA